MTHTIFPFGLGPLHDAKAAHWQTAQSDDQFMTTKPDFQGFDGCAVHGARAIS